MSVIRPGVHDRLVACMDDIVDRSGVPKMFIMNSAVGICRKTDIDWLINFNEVGFPGLKLYGDNALNRCMALSGALIRNFIDVRVRTVDQMLDEPVDCTVLVCPNFYTSSTAKGMPAWRAQKLYDQMVVRFQKSQPTVVWVESEIGLKDYGSPMTSLLDGFYTGS